MATKEKILEEKAFLGDRISTQVRTLALSILALVWLFLVGGKDAPVLPVPFDRGVLLTAGLLALLSLIVDYAQYVCGYKATHDVLRAGEAGGLTDFKYDYKAIAWKGRLYCFWAKQVLMIASILVLGFAIYRSMI